MNFKYGHCESLKYMSVKKLADGKNLWHRFNIQLKLNGSNIFGNMEICSRHE